MRSLACGESFRFNGAVSLQRKGNWIAPWRVPFEEARLYLPEGGIGRAAMPSGVAITLVTNSDYIELDYLCSRCPDNIIDLAEDLEQLESIDVVVGERYLGRRALSASKNPEHLRLDLGHNDGNDRLVELWLPIYAQFRLIDLRVDDAATASASVVNPVRWVHYGGSLSQGMGANSPLTTYVQRSRWRDDLDLVSVARGKGTHLEPMFAALIADLRPRYVTAAVGGMVYLTGSLNQYTYLTNLIGFMKRIIDFVPDCEVVMIVPPASPRNLGVRGPNGMTPEDIVNMHHEAVENAARWGKGRLHEVSQWVDVDDSDFLADGVHLTSAAHRRYGEYLAESIPKALTRP